tara:strand:- start:187 stop:438 length:252 start_codon:yes stop_codon:yes gene_type:complete
MKATLFTTSGCHLCEIAVMELKKLQRSGRIELIKEVEITNSDKLMKKYGVSIPVVKIFEHELYWPFELSDLEIWIKKIEMKKS